ncbi:uncharacterized protein LOC126906377 isoform X2 [Daktulosphaira vitifoliae]|uniref:uncharacterized protein LOC126906377 isoform X2 n=1 Tax=Daktulosphaira vitifoliae TaxID=58002 RepID=UPI0021AADB61|nr:uncharacterized protein LOC126906377 isoform X2 [Daktulosphaira vitifoliae]
MSNRQAIGWAFLCLMGTLIVAPASTYPSTSAQQPLEHRSAQPQYHYESQQHPVYQAQHYPVYQPEQDARKFVEKPNASKKVAASTAANGGIVEDRNDLEDVQTNSISQGMPGMSWSNILGVIMQMLFNPASQVGPSKSDVVDNDQGMVHTSPWANIVATGLKLLSTFLSGGNIMGGDGIDKVDNSSPMQFINIVMNLLDALRTSFSHRSLHARSMGKKDSMSDAAVASISFLKGYVKTMATSDDVCAQKFVCEATKECAGEAGSSSAIYCQLGTYATSYILQKTSNAPFEVYYDAGRRGRSGEDCRQLYLACNEV